MATRTHVCFEIPAVSSTSATLHEGTSDHTNNEVAVASHAKSRSRGADTFLGHIPTISSRSVQQSLHDHGRAGRWTRDFCVILPVHFLLVLDYPTEHLRTRSRLGQEWHILVSRQSGTRLVCIHMVL